MQKFEIPDGAFAVILTEVERNFLFAALTNQAQASEEIASSVENPRIRFAFTREVKRMLDLRDRLGL